LKPQTDFKLREIALLLERDVVCNVSKEANKLDSPVQTIFRRTVRVPQRAESASKRVSFHTFHNEEIRSTDIYEGVLKSFRTESITKYTLTTINTRSEATQRVMAAKLTK
jgi:hypothetical protein